MYRHLSETIYRGNRAVIEGDWMTKCDRCNGDAKVSIMSRFNADTLCMACDQQERGRRDYTVAREAEVKAVDAGDYNFPGIGLPDDV